MKNKTKILLGFGVATTLLTTGSVVISCGSNSDSDQQKLDGITTQTIEKALVLALKPNLEISPPEAPVDNVLPLGNIEINGVTGALIVFSNWKSNWFNGSFTTSIVSISKGNQKVSGEKFGAITISGYMQTNKITPANIDQTQGHLWSWDDNASTLNIFDGVTSLADIQSPTSVGYIWGKGHNTTLLTAITFPNTLTTIGANAFYDMHSNYLISMTIPASVTSIKENAFYNTTSLDKLQFLGSIPGTSTPSRSLQIGNNAFNYTPIQNIVNGDKGTKEQWQAWAKATCPNAFDDSMLKR